jgi:putative transposase
MRTFSIFKGIRGFVTMYNRVVRFRSMYKEAEVRRRVTILGFYETHGLAPTKDAYGVSRATVFRWKHALTTSRGKVTSLDPKPTKPKRVRMRHTDPWVTEFIIQERRLHKLGKAKMHILLKNKGYAGSVNTVGRIMSDLKHRGLVKDPIRYSLYARTGRLHEFKRKKAKKLRRPKGLPCVQIDTVTRHVHGIKRYTVTAIDTTTRLAHAKTYESHASVPAAAFLNECAGVFPHLTTIQTDNGSEFAGRFKTAAQNLNLTHYHIYPRCPDQNAYIERFNRTLDEEFLRLHTRLIRDDMNKLNEKLSEYLTWYNTTRPHHGLGLLSPRQYIARITNRVSEVVG